MKIKLFLIPAALMIILYSANAQIVAGVHSATDLYHEFVPGFNLYADDPDGGPYVNVLSDIDALSFDINNDGVTDLILYAEYSNGDKWFQKYLLYAKPLNGSKIAVSHFDSCFTYITPPEFRYARAIAQSFLPGDSIAGNSIWIDSVAYLAYYHTDAQFIDCQNNYFSNEDSFAGIQLIKNSDTTYGWIQVQAFNFDSCEVFGYACNPDIVSISALNTEPNEIFYPNPTTGKTQLKLNQENEKPVLVQVFDGNGRMISEANTGNNPVVIDLTGQRKGIYYVHTIYRNASHFNKIVVN